MYNYQISRHEKISSPFKNAVEVNNPEESALMFMTLLELNFQFALTGFMDEDQNPKVRYLIESDMETLPVEKINQVYENFVSKTKNDEGFKSAFEYLVKENVKKFNEISKTDYDERVRSN